MSTVVVVVGDDGSLHVERFARIMKNGPMISTTK